MAWFSLLPSLILFVFLSLFSSAFSYSSSIDNINPSPSCHPAPSCHPDERSALLQFKNSFSVNPSLCEWSNSGTTEADCCAWSGVTCDNTTGHVIGLKLISAGLQGIFHSNNTLFFLRHLQTLRLNGNDFRGSTIPSEFGKFSQLEHLELSDSNFAGHVPPEISYLSKLLTLHLSSDYHNPELRVDTFTMRRIVTNLTNLQTFWMIRVDMSSVSPIVLMNLTSSLIYLRLKYGRLGGNLPVDYIFHLPKLEFLDVSWNENLMGSLLSLKSNWSSTSPALFHLDLSETKLLIYFPYIIQNFNYSLQVLYLRRCKILGWNPTLLANLTQIGVLDLGSDNLGGEIPWSSLIHLNSLQFLNLSGNNFTGQLPDEIITAPGPFLLELETLSLSENLLNGTVPSWLYSFKSLYLQNNQFTGFSINSGEFQSLCLVYLDLSNNKLHGSIPTSIFQLVNLTFLSISNNQLSGEIPSSICNLDSLEILDLSNNYLNGTIHPCIGNFSVKLSVLNLGMNKLHGTIPLTFANGNSLRNLNLNGNQLGGILPQSLVRCKNLEVLDVGNNNINGTFPYWLESLPMLQVLILRSNRFHGSIDVSPKTALPFQMLRIMDLSNNEFSGNLPTKYFDNLMAMMDAHSDQLKYMGEEGYYQDSVIVVMKGFLIKFVKIQTIFTTIDLSKNNFEGEIPRLIGKLKSLKGLNFSHNKLIGSIPSTMGNLSNLEWLDLSSNELVGEIPQQLTNMISLEILNLSRNKLVGPIPHGKQFDTFENNSYSENLGLCGIPLSKMCGNNNEPQQSPSPNLQEEEGSWKETYGFGWKIILMGYGCGMVIGVSMGYIVLSNEKVNLFLIRIGFTKLLYA